MNDIPHPDDMLTVGSVWQRSRNALAREFRQAVWIVGEIKNIREWRGNWYLTLIEPGGSSEGSDITLDVACAPKRRLVIQAQLDSAGLRLGSGMVVHVKGPVAVGRLGKLQVELQALDTSALVGAHALERQRVVRALESEGLIDRNRSLPVPLVPLSVGLVGSEGSDGVKDFLGRLDVSGFAFSVSMRHSPVQGPAAAPALTEAIRSLAVERVDLLVVVRGGGGDLDAFDKEPVVRAIAESPHPVWVGIGHTADQSLSDRVANRSCVTPTACADALVECVAIYQRHAVELLQAINRVVMQSQSHASAELRRSTDSLARHASSWATDHHNRLAATLRHVNQSGRSLVDRCEWQLQSAVDALPAAIKRVIHSTSSDVSMQRQQLRLLDPARQLERGYAIVRRKDGSIVRKAADVVEGDEVTIAVGHGKLDAAITSVDNKEESLHG